MALSTCSLFLTSLCLAVAAVSHPAGNLFKSTTDCQCGYYDPATRNLFTDSVIVYFNETKTLPSDSFVVQSYENKYERGWNTRYRQGANASNVHLGTAPGDTNAALELYVDPTDEAHLVVGGGVQTARKDIFYGSFRMLLRSPRMSAPGSALSMAIDWNETQRINMDLMNTNQPSQAWVSMLVHDEFPDRDLGVNYSVLANSTNKISPWDYTEFKVDWTQNNVDYYVGDKLFRSVTKKSDNRFPQTPAPLVLKHWSVGDYFSTQGPPSNRSVANVGWVRLFFNSSLSNDEDRVAFASRCTLADTCSTDDTSLRGSSHYSPAATEKWQQKQPPRGNKTGPIVMLVLCGSSTFFLVSNSLLRRVPWHEFQVRKKLRRSKNEKGNDSCSELIKQSISEETKISSTPVMQSRMASYQESATWSTWETPVNLSRCSFEQDLVSQMVEDLNMCRGAFSSERSDWSEDTKVARSTWSTTERPVQINTNFQQFVNGSAKYGRTYFDGIATEVDSRQPQEIAACDTPESRWDDSDEEIRELREAKGFSVPPLTRSRPSNDKASGPVMTNATVGPTPQGIEGVSVEQKEGECFESPVLTALPSVDVAAAAVRANGRATECNASARPVTAANLPTLLANKERVDYLAGLVAFSSLLVTGILFCLTFVPATINPGAFTHYQSEMISRKIIGSYFLNLIWIGPFLMTSTRFLVSSYLETGNLRAVAEKTVGRPFRLISPVLVIAMLEYFFMDSGATAWLEYLPSVTWSTWPFTTVPNDFGHFVSEILELAYLIPNAAPQITFNYCTGVLWTIPVQLQGSWVTLLGVIVIREIKTPWKRFTYYAFCILMHWYALSWGSYFYAGIMLADLDITYKYQKWLHARPFFYYPILLLCITLGFGGLTIDAVTQWTAVNYSAYEYGIHPDIPTGKPIMLTGAAGYPQYYVPKLNGIIFSVGLQALTELSPLVQRLFSVKLLIYIFPHIFTIYLISGFIFWSLGATICVYLSSQGFVYWLNLLIVAISCYATLMISLPLLTPLVEAFGKHVSANIWQWAYERPAPRRSTLYPFPDDLLLVRQCVAPGVELSATLKRRNRFGRFPVDLKSKILDNFGNRSRQCGRRDTEV